MTTLPPDAQEHIARMLVCEYRHLGLSIMTARVLVSQGYWDDHPIGAGARKANRS